MWDKKKKEGFVKVQGKSQIKGMGGGCRREELIVN